MGGYVNLVFFKGGETRKALSYTGCIPVMQNPAFFDGDESAIAEVFNLYGGCPEQKDLAGGTFAPFDYGLIVIDFDQKTVFDMQRAACLFMTTFDMSQHIFEFWRRGLLGKGLVDMMTGHPFKGGEFPDEARFDSNQELFQWFKWVQRQLWKNEPMSNALPCFRLDTPGWSFEIFEKYEAAAMRDRLSKNGHVFSASEAAEWDNWVAEHPRPAR